MRPPLSSAQAAGRVWTLLAAAFRYPRLDLFEAIRSGAYSAELAQGLGELGFGVLPELEKLEVSIASLQDDFQAFENSYIQALDLADAKRRASPYEANYLPGHSADAVLDVKLHYGASGLTIGPEERPDHVAVELEFLVYLANRQADPVEGDRYRDAERDFLAAHLVHWMPAFSERLAACPGMEVHATLAALAGKLGQARAAAPKDSAGS